MTDVEKVEKLQEMSGETNQSLLLTYLKIAEERILRKVYPFQNDEYEIPSRYENTQLEIAQYLINKRGAEGETAHNENGINRTYESASVPDSMLEGIIPFVGVL